MPMADLTAQTEKAGAPDRSARRRLQRLSHRVGTVLVVLGFLALVYGATVYFWRDPVTDLYARWKQHQLTAQLDELTAQYQHSAASGLFDPATASNGSGS